MQIFKKSIQFLFIIAIVAIICCSCKDTDTTDVSLETSEEKENYIVSVDFLKTGKSDCIVINTGTKIVMIDTAEEKNLSTIHSFMQKKEYEKIDVLILTHFDKDHIGGASEIISTYNVEFVLESNFTSTSKYYENYHNVLNELEITPIKLKENFSFTSDDCNFEISVPKRTKYPVKQDNNASLIISMEYGEKRFLFCGDALELRIAEFIEDLPEKYDVIKLPHHGSCLENYRLFLDEVRPDYAVITCSDKNPASDETLALMEMYEVETYETRYGKINISTDGTEIFIEQ